MDAEAATDCGTALDSPSPPGRRRDGKGETVYAQEQGDPATEAAAGAQPPRGGAQPAGGHRHGQLGTGPCGGGAATRLETDRAALGADARGAVASCGGCGP